MLARSRFVLWTVFVVSLVTAFWQYFEFAYTLAKNGLIISPIWSGALGVSKDYIEYMMGHKVSTYHDVKMKGIEFLRNIYNAAGLSVRPRTRVSKIDALKEIIRAWGMNPEELLTKQALSSPTPPTLTPPPGRTTRYERCPPPSETR